MSDPTIAPKSYVTVSLAQLQTVAPTGEELTFATPEEAQEYQESLAAAKLLGADTILTIPKPTNFEQLGLTDLGLQQAYESIDINLTEIFSMLHEMGVEMRKAGKEARQASREAEQQTLKDSAEKIRSAAHLAMVAGCVSGAMQIAGGIASIGFTAKAFSEINSVKPKADAPDLGSAMSQLKSDLGATPTGRARANAVDTATLKDQITALKSKLNAKPSLDPIELQSASARSQNWMTIGQGSMQIFQGAGAVASAGVQYFSKLEESEKALLDAEASRLNAHVQDETEIINSIKEMIQDVRAKLSEILQTQNQAASKIWS